MVPRCWMIEEGSYITKGYSYKRKAKESTKATNPKAKDLGQALGEQSGES